MQGIGHDVGEDMAHHRGHEDVQDQHVQPVDRGAMAADHLDAGDEADDDGDDKCAGEDACKLQPERER